MDLSSDIVRRIRDGDESAWEEFYLRFRDRLLCSIRTRMGAGLRRHLESEDVFQSVVREALGDLEGFEARGSGSLTKYLHVCVLNKLRKKAAHFGAAKRGAGRSPSDSFVAHLPAPGDEGLRYLDGERFERLERALSSLPERSREVVLLRLVEGAGNAEVAAALGLTPDAASKIYTRALARLAVTGGESEGHEE